MTGESLGSILRRIKAQRETEGAEPAHRRATEASGRPQEPACSACNDRGWLTPSVSVGHPDFSKFQPCTCQEQLLQVGQTTKASGIQQLGEYGTLYLRVYRQR